MDTKQQIKALQQQISLNELADDGYYLSLQYKEHHRLLSALKQQLQTKKKST